MNTYPVDFVKLQQGGTCWFHAALNGWLLSSKGRQLLLTMLSAFKRKYSLSNSNTTCPMRGTLPLGYFWHYVERIITSRSSKLRSTVLKYKVGNVISNNINRIAANMTIQNYLKNGPNMKLRERLNGIVKKAEVHPNNFINSHLIHNVGLRNAIHPSEQPKLADVYRFFGINSSTQMKLLNAGINSVNKLKARLNKSMFANEKNYNQLNRYFKEPNKEYGLRTTQGGTLTDAIRFCSLLFGPAYSRSQTNSNAGTLVVSVPYHDENPREITMNGVKFVLSHAFLHLDSYIGSTNHAICGFIYNGRQFISDSNRYGFFAKHNWTSVADMNKYLALTKSGSFSAKGSLVFYVREDITSYVPNMNALAARRNHTAKYRQINRMLNQGSSYQTIKAYELLLTIPNKNSQNYKNFKQTINSKINTHAKNMLEKVKNLPNNSPALPFILESYKHLPHYQNVRNEIQRKLGRR